MKILGEKKKSNFDDDLADYVNQIYDKMPDEVTSNPPTAQSVKGNVCLEKVSDGFVFHNLPCVGSVKLLNDYLDGGSSKTHGDWRVYCGHSNGVVVPNSIILYQMARVLYELRNDANHMDVTECHALFTQDWTSEYPLTGTEVRYNAGLDAVVEHLQLDGSVKTNNLEFPEFTKYNNDWSCLVLAPAQAEYNLGITVSIPDKAKPVLQVLLGEGYEQVGKVFQYLRSRESNYLEEIRFWTPTLTNRNSERAVVFGVNGIGSNFSINADVVSNRPARGVVAVKENSRTGIIIEG